VLLAASLFIKAQVACRIKAFTESSKDRRTSITLLNKGFKDLAIFLEYINWFFKHVSLNCKSKLLCSLYKEGLGKYYLQEVLNS